MKKELREYFLILFAVLAIGILTLTISCNDKVKKEEPEEEITEEKVITLEELGERYELETQASAEELFDYGLAMEAIPINDSLYVYQGDIILNIEDFKNQPLEVGQEIPKTSAARTKGFWKENKFYYQFSINISETLKTRVKEAVTHLKSVTNIEFIEETNNDGYVTFISAKGCYSSIGRTGRNQAIGLSEYCSTGSIMHEILHALGFWHEQSRSDRDKNLKIHWENITPGMEHNFKTYTEYGFDGQDIGNHDFNSLMHYPPGAFSRNGQPTITKPDGSLFSVNRSKPSAGDISATNKLYPAIKPPEPEKPIPVPTYINGKYYTLHGLMVFRTNDRWYYFTKYGWREVILKSGTWHYGSGTTPEGLPDEVYLNGKTYTISNLTVLRENDRWFYTGPYGKREVVLRSGIWYYK